MNFESLLESQERGVKARILGSPITENPYDRPAGRGLDEDMRAQLCDAWTYGWMIEDAMRQNDTGIYAFLRAETALTVGNNTYS